MERTRTRRLGQKCIILVILLLSLYSCKKEEQQIDTLETALIEEPEDVFEFGFNLNEFVVKRDTVKQGDSFGEILERNQVGYSEILKSQNC